MLKRIFCCGKANAEVEAPVVSNAMPVTTDSASNAGTSLSRRVLSEVENAAKNRQIRIDVFGNTKFAAEEIDKNLDLPKALVEIVKDYAIPSTAVQKAVVKQVRINNFKKEYEDFYNMF